MKILHILFTGEIGGIEKLCLDIGQNDKDHNAFCFLYEGGVICNEMKSKGIEVYEYNINKYNYVRACNVLYKLCNKHGFRHIIVHHNGPSLWIPAIMLKNKMKTIRLYVYAHNTYENFIGNNKIKKIIFGYVSKKAENIIAISKYVKNTIIENCKIENDKVVTVYNGVIMDDFKVERKENFQNPVKIIYVGRLIPEKGVNILIDAVSQIDIPYELEIVGHGVCEDELQNQVKKLNLEDKIHLRGKQRDIKERLQRADIFVHPAIWNEGFGITIAEAMSSGLICIAFNKGAIPELIVDGKTGYCISNVSSKDLAKSLEYIYKKITIDNMIEMRIEAQKRAEMFSIEATIERLHHITQC